MASARAAVSRLLLCSSLCAAAIGCNTKSLEERALADGGPVPPGGLSPEQASKVLARVGARTITLGDYAAALDRMNEFDRMRYQSPERRRDLLNEMIDFELLAVEAQRRGLDKTPETEETIRQILRDTMLADARKNLPAPSEIPQPEVRAYYDAHRDEYREPERRRVSAVVLADKKEAEKTLPEARKASAADWGKLALKFADPPAPKPSAGHPVESSGDLGIVGPPADPKGDHPRVPPEVRAAVFEIQGDVGSVLDRVVESGGKFYLVKLAGKSPPHDRSFAEAERSIRGILVQQKMEQREHDLEESLKKRFPVAIDDAALAQVSYPGSQLPPPPSGAPPASSSAHAPSPPPAPSARP